MPKKPVTHPGLISSSAGGNLKVVMVQEQESSDAHTSVPKVCPDEQYEPSQQVLSVLVRHTYNADPENLEEVNLQNQLTDHLHHNNTPHINGQYTCPSCGRLFVSKTRYKQHVKYPCEGKYKCSSCGKQYSLKPCYEKHLKYLCEVIKKAQPKDTDKDVPVLPRLRIRKPANLIVEEEERTPQVFPGQVEPKVKDDAIESNDHNSNDTEPEATDSWTAEHKAAANGHKGPFTCSCGKLYQYKSWYNRHLRKGCGQDMEGDLSSSPAPNQNMEAKNEAREPSLDKGHNGAYLPSSFGHQVDTVPEPSVASTGPSLEVSAPALRVQQWVVDSVPRDQLVYCCSVPYCGESFMEEGALRDHQSEHVDLGPENGGNKKRRWLWVHEDQAVSGTSGSNISAGSHEPHTDYLSMIQISNVMSLVTSQDELLPMTEEVATSSGKGAEPECGDPSSASIDKDVATPADKPRWRSWVQKCIRNRKRTPKWGNSGGRREVCLLCGRRFSQNTALDQHMVSAHCQRFQYRCGNCNMSFKARTCLCRHVLQAHCGEREPLKPLNRSRMTSHRFQS